MLNGVNYSAPTSGATVTGVKGDAETEYRTGDVNLTPENIGALPEDGNAVSATKATKDGNENVIADTYAKKSIYSDTVVSMGRKTGTTVGSHSFAFGDYVEASGNNSRAEGYNTMASGSFARAEGQYTTARGSNSRAEGQHATAGGDYSYAEGPYATASNYASHAFGKYNKGMTMGGGLSNTAGDVFVIGNGTTSSALSNAFRVTYTGDIYGTKAFQSSGADYAEFIKPWADNNKENEDRVGYFVTIKDGLLYKANEDDYIVGITSGNPSIVGNADEDYYWRYERDSFNRIVMEDVPEAVQETDADGNPVFDEETHEPVMVETGNIVPNARMKLADDYNPELQKDYIERKDRKEWDYVGMLGVLPVRDDGTCIAGQLCKCGKDGIATLAAERSFDTYMVIERIADNVVNVILK